MGARHHTRRFLKYPLLLAGSLILGTVCHEVVGHGLVGVACGGTITRVVVLGLQLYPNLTWVGTHGRYGHADISGVNSTAGVNLVSLGGSMSTWCISVLAVSLLWMRWWPRWARTILVCLAIWWIDLLTYTLPSWGLRRSIFWGRIYSEPYEAATALGIPGPVFQAFVVCTSMILATALALRVIRSQPEGNDRTRTGPKKGFSAKHRVWR